ncbi:fructose-specific PTS transporter subunit EIIC [Aerococcus sp. UMB7834]|uniref:PTS fructose transporter subunit IIABC n=1 Tax=Aerococcus sp. UMB7834 TaxID=3046342 RepID=UPI00254C0168|nr:fructose-specific PTS transporter subunit EIIC [Aerococcus sp. UMB7834]MDK6805182.1 fructose-specific PTS transporter subunit EIIC [Aerococcus sp. UMB7834]
MALADLFIQDAMDLDLQTTTKTDTLKHLAEKFAQAGGVTNVDEYVAKLEAREEMSTTGVGDEIAIPHAQHPSIKQAAVIFGRSKEGIEWESMDGQPAKLIFMIAAPEGEGNEHLQALSKLSGVLMKPEAKAALLEAETTADVVAIMDKFDPDKEEEAEEEEVEAAPAVADDDVYILAVTACPTGIAHTYMAEEKLKQAAEKAGYKIKVETNGQGGVNHRLTKADIDAATAIIVAADRKVEINRFDGKPVIFRKVADGINMADELIRQAAEGEAKTFHASESTHEEEEDSSNESLGRQIYKHLMNGVSHMLPFVVAGGMLIAISFFWGINSADPADPSFNEIAHFLNTLGGLAFAMMLPVLAGFIGQSIADTPGLVVGAMGGVFANPGILTAFNQEGYFATAAPSGFLGALVAGFLAGGIIWLLKKAFAWLPKSLEGMKPIFIYPLFGVLLMGLAMFFVVNTPMGMIMDALTNGLASIPSELGVVLGFIVGAMMSIDMGGPLNKAAYVTGTALVTQANGAGSDVMAAVMVGGMVPPMAIAISATLNRNLWPEAQRNSAIVNYVMGAAFITEGAIPFAASNPVRVIPSLAIGAGVAGALSMFFNCVSYVPHGGIFAVLTNGVTNPVQYVIAWLVGSVVGALLLNFFLKRDPKAK